MAQVKAGKKLKSARLLDDVDDWLKKQADYNGTNISAEINIAVREKMERQLEAQAAKARALASAGT